MLMLADPVVPVAAVTPIELAMYPLAVTVML
jgi:hypothetical protein